MLEALSKPPMNLTGGLSETSDIENSLSPSYGFSSELQALVFDLKYIQFKPKGGGVTF